MIARVLRIGEHTVRIGEHEDTVDLLLRGDVSPDEVVRFFDFMASHLAGQRYMLVTGDVVQVGRIPAESRKRVVKESGRVPPIRGVVYYRVTFTGRVMTELVLRGYALATGVDVAAHFANEEAEARAWLARRRAQLAREHG
ncbi:hypothetical protein WME75_24875 [Sorangium sp. So ce1014]|uniref:hypothetical protein n=1 Tax=Sorangium sp. So ce1014 TaxID=3133326 RepID=UPI003F5DEB3D